LRLNSQYENRFFQNRRSKITSKIQKATRNAASGVKLQTAADNPAGLAVSEVTRAQIRGLAQAQRNMQDGMALFKTAEDGIMKTNEDVQRLYEISVMASNDTMDDKSRGELQVEVEEILSSIEQTAQTLQFNTWNLLGPDNKSDKQKNVILQIGSNINENMTFELFDTTTASLGIDNASVSTRENAINLLEKSQDVIKSLTNKLTRVGAQYASLEHDIDNSITLQNNLTIIESNIRDSNIGKEVIDLTLANVLSSAVDSLHKFSDDQRQNFEKIIFG
jgi:flagellin